MQASLSQEVYKTLLDKLLRNDLIPGTLLNRREIASQLGVSVAPVLEAMLQLQMEGFLESLPRKGTQVRIIKPDDIWGQLMIREALECQAARMYCGEPVEKHENHLLKTATMVDSTAPNLVEHWRGEIELHLALLDLTQCEALTNEYKRVIHLSMFFGINQIVTHYENGDISDHCELIQSLKTPDPDEAERIMREHVRRGKGLFLQQRM